MSSYKRNYSNYKSSYKPKTVGFDDTEEEDLTDTEDLTESEEEDQYGELILSKVTELITKLDNCINLVKELKQ